MKTSLTKKFIGFVFLLNFYSVYAQANLQFSQVKLIGVTTETVPIGKVWKIESISYTQGLSHLPNGDFTTTNSININSVSSVVRTVCGRQSSSGVAYGVWEQNWPMWLPSGTTLSAGTGITNISIIEFNLIP